MTKREIFNFKGSNAAAIAPAEVIAIQNRDAAEKNNYLPHNALTIANTSTTCTLFIFLDSVADHTTPDYVLFPNQNMTITEEEGAHWTTLFIKNTHGANDVAINELKHRISTVREV